MPLDILGDPFANSAQTSLDESSIRDMAPAMPDTKVQDLIRAANQESWDKQEGMNEKFMLDKELEYISSYLSAELGPFTLDLYSQAQDIISAAVLRLTNEGDRTGSFRGKNARGGSQWDIQQINVASLNDTSSVTSPSQYRTYTPGSTGNFNIAPAITPGGAENRDPSNTSTGTNGDGTHTLDTDTQAVVILGLAGSTNPRVVEEARVSVDDGETRTPFDIYQGQNLGTLQATDLPSLEYITDDDDFDINGTATQDSTTDIYPFGVDVNTAAQLNGLNTQA